MEKINAFILAAGLGERLRPATSQLPKPLLPILGKPVVERILEKISGLSFEHIGMNLHHKGQAIQEWILASRYAETVQLFYEDPVLGTGGALKNAGSLLDDALFLVHNADILSDVSLTTLIERHESSGDLVTLAVHDFPEYNSVWIDDEGLLIKVGSKKPEGGNGLRPVAFTGIAVYSPEFLQLLPEGYSSVVSSWLKAVSLGRRVGTVDFTGCSWRDIGSPHSYATAVFTMLRAEGETVYIDPSIDCSRLEMGAYSVIEKGSLFKGAARLTNCITLPGASVKDGAHIEDAIVGKDYRIPIPQTQIMLNNIDGDIMSMPILSNYFNGLSDNASIALIGVGGSDRRYYRITDKGRNAVLMSCSEQDADYRRHIAYTEFFGKYSIPVPELRGVDTERRSALFEDLGDISLYSWLKCRKDPEHRERMYRKVLDIVIDLQNHVTAHVSECPELQGRVFDYEHLRWETDYFIDRFVRAVRGLEVDNRRPLEREFVRLARKVDSFAKTIVHRDFQSQNIMVVGDGIPRIVDYQGARIGPPAYDIASILWDPYVRIEEDMRERLLDYYIEKKNDSLNNTFEGTGFMHVLLPCRLQRHMQALGAYGFLSQVKGKTYFLKYIPMALHYLNEEIAFVRDEYPALYGLIRKIG